MNDGIWHRRREPPLKCLWCNGPLEESDGLHYRCLPCNVIWVPDLTPKMKRILVLALNGATFIADPVRPTSYPG